MITNASNVSFIFDDQSAQGTFSVTGEGVFVHAVMYITTSVIDIKCKKLAENNSGWEVATLAGSGRLTIDGAELSGGSMGVYVASGSPTVKINRCYISAGTACVDATTGATPSISIRDCVFVSSGTYSVFTVDATNMRIYGRLMANKTSSGVTFITGSSHFEVDTDVQ